MILWVCPHGIKCPVHYPFVISSWAFVPSYPCLLLHQNLGNHLKHPCTTVSNWPVSLPGACSWEERLGDSQQWILSSSCLRCFFSFCLSLVSLFLPFNQFSQSLKREAQGFLFPRETRKRAKEFLLQGNLFPIYGVCQ